MTASPTVKALALTLLLTVLVTGFGAATLWAHDCTPSNHYAGLTGYALDRLEGCGSSTPVRYR